MLPPLSDDFRARADFGSFLTAAGSCKNASWRKVLVLFDRDTPASTPNIIFWRIALDTINDKGDIGLDANMLQITPCAN